MGERGARESICLPSPEVPDPPGAGVTGVCESLDMDAGNQTRVLHKSSVHS